MYFTDHLDQQDLAFPKDYCPCSHSVQQKLAAIAGEREGEGVGERAGILKDGQEQVI